MPERTADSFDPRNGHRLTRRDIGRLMSAGVAALVLPGRASAAPAQNGRRAAEQSGPPVAFRLSSNENNYGLAPAAIATIRLKPVIGEACRYGAESAGQLTAALAKAHGVPPDHIMLAAGSGEILRAVTLAFTGPGKPLVSASPTFESPGRTALGAKAEVRAIPVAPDGTLDLKAMAAAASGAGLAFVCNPNNPTGGINPEAAVTGFVKEFRTAAPEGYILVDEAYCDYVTDTSYASAIPITMRDPRVLVSRTFSKIHGMAGIRVGYVDRPPRRARRHPGEDELGHPLEHERRCGARLVPGSGASHPPAHAQPRHAGVHAEGVRDRRLQGAALRGQLRDGRRPSRVVGLPADVPGRRRRHRATVSAVDELRADHHRDDGRDAEGAAAHDPAACRLVADAVAGLVRAGGHR